MHSKPPRFLKIACLLIWLLLLVKGRTWAQEKDTTLGPRFEVESISLELLGVAGHYSLNADVQVYSLKKTDLRIGVGVAHGLIGSGELGGFEWSPRVPIRLKLIRDVGKHRFGGGVFCTPYYWIERDEGVSVSIGPILEYEYLFIHGNSGMGISFSPIVYDQDLRFIPWGGLRFVHKIRGS